MYIKQVVISAIVCRLVYEYNLSVSLFVLYLSHGRTDRGVHALRSSAHIDLERVSGLQYDPARLTAAYNHYLTKNNFELR